MQPPYTNITMFMLRDSEEFMIAEPEAILFDEYADGSHLQYKTEAEFIHAVNKKLSQVANLISPGAYIRRYMRHRIDTTLLADSPLKQYKRILSRRIRKTLSLCPEDKPTQIGRICENWLTLTGVPKRDRVPLLALALDLTRDELNRFLADYFCIGALNWRCPEEAALAFVLESMPKRPGEKPRDMEERLARRYQCYRSLCAALGGMAPAACAPQAFPVTHTKLVLALNDSIEKERLHIQALKEITDEAAFMQEYARYLKCWAAYPRIENRVFAYCYHTLVADMHEQLYRETERPDKTDDGWEMNGNCAPRLTITDKYARPQYADGYPVWHKESKKYKHPLYYQPIEVERFLYPGIPFEYNARDRTQAAHIHGDMLHAALNENRLTADRIAKYLRGKAVPRKEDVMTLLFALINISNAMHDSIPSGSGDYPEDSYLGRLRALPEVNCGDEYYRNQLILLNNYMNSILRDLGEMRPSTPYGYFLTALTMARSEYTLETFRSVYACACGAP